MKLSFLIQKLYLLAAPGYFYQWTANLLPWLLGLALLCIVIAIGGGYYAPADAIQGEAFRIMYVHVPCALLSLGFYMSLALCSFMGLVWRIKVAFLLARSFAILGAILTALALISGSIWAKPMWGAWWIWDARLTSELILFFLYIGYLALYNALLYHHSRDTVCAILALIGAIDIPIIHYSVEWWNTLHQGATISKLAKPSIDMQMAWPLFLMIIGIALYSMVIVLVKTRTELLKSHTSSRWLRKWL